MVTSTFLDAVLEISLYERREKKKKDRELCGGAANARRFSSFFL